MAFGGLLKLMKIIQWTPLVRRRGRECAVRSVNDVVCYICYWPVAEQSTQCDWVRMLKVWKTHSHSTLINYEKLRVHNCADMVMRQKQLAQIISTFCLAVVVFSTESLYFFLCRKKNFLAGFQTIFFCHHNFSGRSALTSNAVVDVQKKTETSKRERVRIAHKNVCCSTIFEALNTAWLAPLMQKKSPVVKSLINENEVCTRFGRVV